MNDDSLTPVQRAAAIDRAGETLLLRSGAGSGKTFVLARRFVECLLNARDPDRALSRLVALTFTEKAAVEMSQRVRSMLEALASSGRVEPAQAGAWLEQLPEARISTIHGFCASLLRTWSVEAGVDPGFSVCSDELLASRLRRASAEETLLSGAAEEDNDVAGILLSLSAARAVDLLSDLSRDHSLDTLRSASDATENLRRWRAHWRVARREAWERMARDGDLRKAIDRVADGVCDDPNDRLERLRLRRLELAARVLADASARTPEAFDELTGKTGNIGSGKTWRSPTPKEMRARVKAMGERFASYADYASDLDQADEAAAEALARLARTARKVSKRFLDKLAARGMLGFDHLLSFAERLLRTDAGIRAAVSGGIDQLLVDESQDTDAVQWSLIARAASGAGLEAGLADGRLFAVGDAKQSIYRFRGAKVEVFGEVCDRLGADRQERLDVSFRTHAAGVAFVNELFGRLWAEDYEPTRAHRADLPEGPSVEVLLAGGADTPEPVDESESTRAQAGVVAERILRMVGGGERIVRDRRTGLARPARYGDVAVLFTRMTHSLAYERELQRRGVPYYVVGGTGFFRRQEVYDILNALRVIDNPLDDIALAGVLRSSLSGLDDQALMHIARAVGTPWLEGLRRRFEAGDDALEGVDPEPLACLRETVELLGRLGAVKDAIGIDGLIRRLVDATGYEAVLLAAPRGARMVGNVRRLEEMAREATAGGLRLSEFIETVGEQVLHQARCEQAAVVGEEEDVVRLMTVHRAKGLEFPVVFVPDLNAARRGLRGDVLEHGPWGLTCRLTSGRAEDDAGPESPDGTPLSFRRARADEKAAADAEDIRLLYVAMTRHEDHLVLVAGNRRAGDDRRLAPKDSPIALLDDALGLRAALDRPGGRMPYGAGRFEAVVAEVDPPAREDRPAQPPPGQRLVDLAETGADLVASLPGARDGTLPLLGPPDCRTARAELAVTALSDVEHCPMLYRWRYELRVPDRPAGRPERDASPSASTDPPAAPLDALTLGTFFHRCMELLDVRGEPDAARLAARVADEMEIDDLAHVDRLAGELAGMVDRFANHELREALVSARRSYRELDFLLSVGPLRLRGQIDLLFQDAAGTWRIVDYKSDRLGEESPAERMARYRLQLSAYALAVARHRGEAPGSATLYFLREARSADLPLGAGALAGAAESLQRLGRELVSARRTGRFDRRRGEQCGFCPYARLCGEVARGIGA